MLQAFLTWLLSLLTGPAVDKVLGHLERRAENETEREKVRTQATVEMLREAVKDAQDQRRAVNEIRKATAGNIEMRVLTVLIALPFVIHVNLVGLDTNFLGGTLKVPKFPPPFDEWEGMILLSFFGIVVGGMGLKALAGAIALGKSRG